MVSAPKPGKRRVAALVLPHWNASATQHNALCAGLAKLGISALRLSMPYHDYRMPAELERADYAVSSNVARTIDATRQAVIDTRSCVDWLDSRGLRTRRPGAAPAWDPATRFLASVHDPRLEVNVFNHCSTYFADVVWEGLSSQHIRQVARTDCDARTVARDLDGHQSAELHRALRHDEEEDRFHLRALRHDVSDALFRSR